MKTCLDILYSICYLQVIWGVSCGVPDKEAEASSCVTVTTDTSDGYLCTCNSSYCNAIERCVAQSTYKEYLVYTMTNVDVVSFFSGKAMISRAELGITGSGLECHTCSGEAGLCSTADDEGTAVDCGEGVDTCLVASSTIISNLRWIMEYLLYRDSGRWHQSDISRLRG